MVMCLGLGTVLCSLLMRNGCQYSNPLHAAASQLIKPAVQCGEMPSQTHALGMTSVLDCMAIMMITRAMVWMSYFEYT